MIDLVVQNGCAEIVLNNPKALNSLSEDDLADLSSAYTEACEREVRALLLRGEGRSFCAGRNIRGVDPSTDDATDYLANKVTPVLQQMSTFPAPTFAAVQGACLGVGLGLAISCDIVYVADNASIGSPFASLGAILDSGGHAFFFERLGAHRAMDLIVTGDMLTGSQAVSEGLFSRSLPESELLEFAREKSILASNGPTKAFLASRSLIHDLQDDRIGLWESIKQENQKQGELCRSTDYAEGFAAFNEKRRPRFIGR